MNTLVSVNNLSKNFSSFEAETLVRDFYKGKKIDKFAAKIFLDDFIRENTLLDEKEY